MSQDMPKKYLGIDYGKKRIGLAVSDESGNMAFPKGIFENKGKKDAAEAIWKMCNIELGGVKDIVLGESKNFKGEDNEVMEDVREFAEYLKSHALNVIFEPEIMSTIQAERLQGQRADIDASAAAVILQSYLDRVVKREKTQETLEEIDQRKYSEQTRFE